MSGEAEVLFAQVAEWQAAGRLVALATVVRTWGSSPRPEGSHLAVSESGAFLGSVSGGCIEGAVIGEALEVLADGKPRLLEFGVTDEQAWEVGLACGGRLQVFVEPMNDTLANRLKGLHAARQSCALLTRLTDGAHLLITTDEEDGELQPSEKGLAEARRLLQAGRSGLLPNSDEIFVRSYPPGLRLLLIGAVHIAQFLAPLATVTGLEVIVIDPRRAFATAERFPGVTLLDEWPDKALAQIGIDASTAVVTLTHDPKLDNPALSVALTSPAFYIGALGSSRTHAKRMSALSELGLEEILHRIHAPVGLALGGRMPAEIAVAILAQIIQERHAR